jgi:predicted small lipoprotein YifL
MSNVRQILVSAIGLVLVGVALGGCGQKGALYLPTDPAAKDRATLPDLLLPRSGGSNATPGGTGADTGNAPAPKTEGTK